MDVKKGALSKTTMVYIKPHHTGRDFWYRFLTPLLIALLLFLVVVQRSSALDFGKAIYGQRQTIVMQSVGSTILRFVSAEDNVVLVGIVVLLVGIIVLLFLSLSIGRVLKDIQTNLNHIINRLQHAVPPQSQKISSGAQERKGTPASLEGIEELLQQSPQDSQPTPPTSEDLHDSNSAGVQNSQEQMKQGALHEPKQRIGGVDPTQPLQPRQSEPNTLMSLDLKRFCELYNAGEQSSLRAGYQPHYRIGVINASDRRRNSNTPAVFMEDTAGRFLAYYIESEKSYVVVPRFDMTLQDSIYGPGAFGEVFECPNFNPQHAYRNRQGHSTGIL